MPILSDIGKRSPGQIAVRAGIYLLLTLGALAILYPVLIVVGQTLSDRFDLRDNAIVPYYLRDRNELALKYVFSFSRKLELMASRHNRNQWTNQVRMRDDKQFYQTRPAALAAQGLSLEAWQTVLDDLNAFKAQMDSDRLMAKEFRLEDHYRPFLRDKYGREADRLLAEFGRTSEPPAWLLRTIPDADEREEVLADRDRLGVAIMNHELRSDYLNYYSVEVTRPGNFAVPFWRPGREAKDRMWSQFKASLPPEQKLIVSSDTYWHVFLKLKYRNVQTLNHAWRTRYGGLYELRVSFQRPRGASVWQRYKSLLIERCAAWLDEAPGELPRAWGARLRRMLPPRRDLIRKDWDEFVVKRWPRRLLKVPPEYAPGWRRHVRRQLLARIGEVEGAEREALRRAGRLVGETIRTWDDLPLPQTLPDDETLGRYWCEFTSSGAIPPEKMVLDAPERNFPRFLRRRYGKAGRGDADALAALNHAWKTSFRSFDEVPLPLTLADYAPVRFRPTEVRLLFMTESFRRVVEYMRGRGRAARNTLILVVCSLLSALTINPIAAYSLSLFPMKHTQKILIFFLATMAFPAEVAMIPNFLLLRDLGLLNTYAALILPGMANGFAIFLLKGFFDSLPRELYEAAEIDGASELQIFRVVAMPLVKPILAFIGLNTFVFAYSSFMWAFVICPKQEMWTLMVWVYDFQMKNPGNNYIMAATVLVSIPPLIVFFFANRIIMRGIVIPSMK